VFRKGKKDFEYEDLH